MRITHEADYAIRVTYCLALAGEKQCAKDISEATGVTLRFALKILRKLTQSGIAKSYKGVAGGNGSFPAPSKINLFNDTGGKNHEKVCLFRMWLCI